MFFCPAAQATWRACQYVPDINSFPSFVLWWQSVQTDSISYGSFEAKYLIAFTCWEILKSRNKAVIEHTPIDPIDTAAHPHPMTMPGILETPTHGTPPVQGSVRILSNTSILAPVC